MKTLPYKKAIIPKKHAVGSDLGKFSAALKKQLQEEYELIQQKKSSLSRRMRSYVEYLHSKMQEPKEEGEIEA